MATSIIVSIILILLMGDCSRGCNLENVRQNSGDDYGY